MTYNSITFSFLAKKLKKNSFQIIEIRQSGEQFKSDRASNEFLKLFLNTKNYLISFTNST